MTKAKLVPFLVRRYLRFNKAQPFISITAILAFLGVCIGVMVLIVAMALMNGFDKEFERKLFIMNYPITMLGNGFERVNSDTLKSLEQDFKHLKFSPFIHTQALSKIGEHIEGAAVFGVDFEKESLLNPVFAAAFNATKESYQKRFAQKYQAEMFDTI